MSREMANAVIANLKRFNAKERDHLMRFAYLGENSDYSEGSRFLSTAFDAQLRPHLADMGLAPTARCVFAGMDYHLDWLFAALWLARSDPGEASDPLRVPMAPHAPVVGLKGLYTDFRPLNGSQEDIDLLAVYDDGARLAVLLIEAKGSAAFDRVQLARKLIRLDRILIESGMTADAATAPMFRLILAAPKRPAFNDCRVFARGLPVAKTGTDKFQAMRDALARHSSGIGEGMHFLELSGFPRDTYAVERIAEVDVFSHWTLRKRP